MTIVKTFIWFFLLLFDRLTNFVLELKNVHYAKSIKFLTRLVGGTSYIQPPVLIINYDELSQSDLNQEKIVLVKFRRKNSNEDFRTDFLGFVRQWISNGFNDTHSRHLDRRWSFSSMWNRFISFSNVHLVSKSRKTNARSSRSLRKSFRSNKKKRRFFLFKTIGKFFLKLCNIVATVFFIVMAGVSMWWLVFFKVNRRFFVFVFDRRHFFSVSIRFFTLFRLQFNRRLLLRWSSSHLLWKLWIFFN